MLKFSLLKAVDAPMHQGQRPVFHVRCLLSAASKVTPGGVGDKMRFALDLKKKLFCAVYGGYIIMTFKAANLIQDTDSPEFYMLKGLIKDAVSDLWPDEDDITKVIAEIEDIGAKEREVDAETS